MSGMWLGLSVSSEIVRMRFIDYPLVMTNIVIEHGPVEIVDLHIKNGGSFHSYVSIFPPNIWGFSMV